MKFGRRYRLTVEMNDASGGVIIIEPPFTLQFNVVRSVGSALNTAHLAIYNLSEATRSRIFRDRYAPIIDATNYPKVILEAGYEQLTTIFIGSIFEASSARQGVDIITTITARDGGVDVTGSQTSMTLNEGTTIIGLIEKLIGQFPTLEKGKIGEFVGDFKRPVSLDGNTYELLKQYTNGNVFVDLQKVVALQSNELLTDDVIFIDADTGLLETPRRENSYLSVTMLFEPQITMAQLAQLNSTTLPRFNGEYKVVGVQHQGIISEAVNGECQTIVNLFSPLIYTGGGNNA